MRMAPSRTLGSTAAEALEQLMRWVSAEAYATDLTPQQWSVLRFLARAQPSLRTVKGFAGYHQTTLGTASQTLATLERRGLIQRRPNPDDGRSHILELTETAQQVMATDPLSRLVAAINDLPEAESQSFVTSLTAICLQVLPLAGTTSAAQRDKADRGLAAE